MAKLDHIQVRGVDLRTPLPTSRVTRENARRAEENYRGTTWLEFIAWQWNMNKLRQLWSSDNPPTRQVGEVMNTVVLVNAVVLVMTTSILLTLHKSHLQGLYQTGNISWSEIRYTTEYPLYVSALCSSEGAVFGMLYHLMAPTRQASFRVWWSKGKYDVLLIVLLTAVATVSYLFIAFTEWYVILTTQACLEHPILLPHYGKVVFVLASVFYILFRPKFLLPFFSAFSLTGFVVYFLVMASYNSALYFGRVATAIIVVALGFCVYLNHLRMNIALQNGN